MSSNPHRVLTPVGASRKRKERDALDAPKASTSAAQAEPPPDNRLLAGYLAHEFLTKGTIFGQRWDPAGAEQATSLVADSKKPNPTSARPDPKATSPKRRAYADVAHLLKTDGTHIPGVLNPSQLTRWLQM
ncbi:uncharacterized protein LOC131245814 [Magnolia sinica]|uniref:uncharacterized protein LOC131245814 n=1 Tax=Magnolia sinica TaxID=86752 RepID=UPI0026599D3B|nr:uncharacterized protein LOC131245814 [Magnolia sinica]